MCMHVVLFIAISNLGIGHERSRGWLILGSNFLYDISKQKGVLVDFGLAEVIVQIFLDEFSI